VSTFARLAPRLQEAIVSRLGWGSLRLLLDSWLGTEPVFMIALSVISAVGQFIRMKYVYDAEMERLEAQRLAGRRAADRPSGSWEDAA